MGIIDIPTFIGIKETASQLYESFYGFASPSLAVINGELDQDNVNDFTELSYRNVQRKTFSTGGQVGGTATLDYFHGGSNLPRGFGWFQGITGSAAQNRQVEDRSKRWLPIPGASLKFYLPNEGFVLFCWSITWANDSQNDDYMSHVALYIDGLPAVGPAITATDPRTRLFYNPTRRRLLRSQFDSGGGSDVLIDRYKGRFYSGHFFTPVALSPGFHEVSLRVCGNAAAKTQLKQTKIRARSMKYIYFRNGATF